MRHSIVLLALAFSVAAALPRTPAVAQTFNSGSTGADGAFNPTADITLALPPSGVFNFTTINIPRGVTVRFRRNAANTPVTMLASGDVTIAGTLTFKGKAGVNGCHGYTTYPYLWYSASLTPQRRVVGGLGRNGGGSGGDSVGGTIENIYDALDRLVSVSTALGTINYQHDVLGRRTRMDVPGQAAVTYGYDAASRPTAPGWRHAHGTRA